MRIISAKIIRLTACATVTATLLALPAVATTTTQAGLRVAESGFGPANLSANLNRSLRVGDHKTGATASVALSLSASEASTRGSYTAPARVTPATNASLRAWKALGSHARLNCAGSIAPSLGSRAQSLSANCGVSARKRFGSRVYGSFGANARSSGAAFDATNFASNASFQITPLPKRAPRLRMNTGVNYSLGTAASGAQNAQVRSQVSASYAWAGGTRLNIGANLSQQQSASVASAWSAARTNTARNVGVTASLGGAAGDGRWRASLSASQNAAQSSWGVSTSRRATLTTSWSGAAEPGRWQPSLTSSLNFSRSVSSASNTQRLSLNFRPVPPAEPTLAAKPARARTPKPTLSVSFDVSRSASRSAWSSSESWNANFRIARSFGVSR